MYIKKCKTKYSFKFFTIHIEMYVHTREKDILHAYIHTYMHTYIHTYMHTYIHMYTSMNMNRIIM